MTKKLLILSSLMLLLPALIKAQEEVILSSENMEEAEKEETWVKVKPVYRYVDSTRQTSLFILALRPEGQKFPGTYDRTKTDAFGLSFNVGYEQLLKNRQFSVFIESSTRLHSVRGGGYDYGFRYRFLDSNARNPNRGGEYDALLSTLDIGAKFYYRQRKRIAYGASDVNPFNDYFFLRARDVLSYVRRTTIITSQFSGLTELHLQERKWLMSPGYIQGGWGTQRRIYNRLMVDFYIGLGFRVMGDREHAHRDALFDIGLNIGLGLGKRK